MVALEKVIIPQDWKRIGRHCYVDSKGKPHILTKTTYVSDPHKHQDALKRARKNREKSAKRAAEWRKKNAEKKNYMINNTEKDPANVLLNTA